MLSILSESNIILIFLSLKNMKLLYTKFCIGTEYHHNMHLWDFESFEKNGTNKWILVMQDSKKSTILFKLKDIWM